MHSLNTPAWAALTSLLLARGPEASTKRFSPTLLVNAHLHAHRSEVGKGLSCSQLFLCLVFFSLLFSRAWRDDCLVIAEEKCSWMGRNTPTR